MATATDRILLTAEEYLANPEFSRTRNELVNGEVVELSPWQGFEHRLICVNVGYFLSRCAREAGHVFGNNTAVRTTRNPDSVRGADVMYYSIARLPRDQITSGVPEIPPDVIFEVVSPSDRMREVRQKVNEYLAAGVALVGVVDPRTRTVSLFRDQDLNSVVLGEAETLRELPELPGFELSVADIFG
jgi:Uma2 family endonuclease